jgi:hypothetical protein
MELCVTFGIRAPVDWPHHKTGDDGCACRSVLRGGAPTDRIRGGEVNRRDERLIRRILEETYVNDMYVPKGRPSFSPVFHGDFRMLLPEYDGQTGRIRDVKWVRPDPSHRPNPKAIESKTRFEVSVLDITGKVGIGKVEVHRDGRLKYTDYVVFCKVEGEWRVVGKAFHPHGVTGPA